MKDVTLTLTIKKEDGTTFERVYEGASYVEYILEEAGILTKDMAEFLASE